MSSDIANVLRPCFNNIDALLSQITQVQNGSSNMIPAQLVQYITSDNTVTAVNSIVQLIITAQYTTLKCIYTGSNKNGNICAPIDSYKTASAQSPVKIDDLINIINKYQTILQTLINWMCTVLNDYMNDCKSQEDYAKAQQLYNSLMSLISPPTPYNCVANNAWASGGLCSCMCLIICILCLIICLK